MKKRYLITISILVFGGLLGNFLRFISHKPESLPDFSGIPYNVAGYNGSEIFFDQWAYDVLNADMTTCRDYIDPGGLHNELLIAYFGSQKFGRAPHSPKNCLPGSGWTINEISPYRLNISDNLSIEVNRLVISDPSQSSVMFYWYQTRSGVIRDEYFLLLDKLKNTFLLRPDDIAFVRFETTIVDDDIRRATEEAVQFVTVFYPYVEVSLPF